jgi:hypothetical protein
MSLLPRTTLHSDSEQLFPLCLDIFVLAVIFAQIILGLEFTELHKLILLNANFPIKRRKVPVPS